MPESVSLVFATQPTKVGTVTLDASLRETHTRSAVITDHPVEEGPNISDHIRAEPPKLQMDGIVSNTPINRTQRRRVVEAFGVEFETSALDDQRQGAAGYAEAAYAKLEELHATGAVFTVVTQIRTYDNMAFESLVVPRDAKTGDAVNFSATLKQVIVVKNKTTRKVVSKEPRAQPRNKTGTQTPKTATEAQKKKSILYKRDESTGRGLSKLLSPPSG